MLTSSKKCKIKGHPSLYTNQQTHFFLKIFPTPFYATIWHHLYGLIEFTLRNMNTNTRLCHKMCYIYIICLNVSGYWNSMCHQLLNTVVYTCHHTDCSSVLLCAGMCLSIVLSLHLTLSLRILASFDTRFCANLLAFFTVSLLLTCKETRIPMFRRSLATWGSLITPSINELMFPISPDHSSYVLFWDVLSEGSAPKLATLSSPLLNTTNLLNSKFVFPSSGFTVPNEMQCWIARFCLCKPFIWIRIWFREVIIDSTVF